MAGLAALRAGGKVERALREAVWAGGAIAVGVIGIAAAYFVHPLVGPALLLGVALVALTLQRPAIGIAAWFLMYPLSRAGLLGQPPWLVASAWSGLLFVIALTSSRGAARDAPPLGLAVLLVVVVTVAQGMLLTDTVSAALPFMRTVVTGGMVFMAVALLIRTREDLLLVLLSLAGAAAFAGLLGVQQYTSGDTDIGFLTSSGELVPRVTAGFGQPNQYAGFLVILVPLIVVAGFLMRRGRILMAGAALLSVIGIYLSYSRGALLALAIAPFVLLGARRALLLAPVGLLAILSFTPDLLKERFTSNTGEGAELAGRADFWSAAQSIWLNNPVFGVGPGGFPTAYATVRIPGKDYLPSTQFEPPPHAHNLLLQIMAEQGLLGLLVFALPTIGAVLGLLRVRRRGERWMRLGATGILAALAAFAAHNAFDVTLIEGTGEYFWALIGLAAALITCERAVRPGSGAADAGPRASRAG